MQLYKVASVAPEPSTSRDAAAATTIQKSFRGHHARFLDAGSFQKLASIDDENGKAVLARAKTAKKQMTLSAGNADDLKASHLPSILQRSRTKALAELHNTMTAAQEQLRPFCMSKPPPLYPGCSWYFLLHVCIRPLLERFSPSWWCGFYVELARLGGPSGVLTLLTIARIDTDLTGDIDEDEIEAFESAANKLIADTCDALQTSAVVASLLFGATFQSVIGRPDPMEASAASVATFGQGSCDALLWMAGVAMSLISILCLLIIAYAFGSRMELQNVLPSTEARLFYLCEVNPMNLVVALALTSMLLFILLIIAGEPRATKSPHRPVPPSMLGRRHPHTAQQCT